MKTPDLNTIAKIAQALLALIHISDHTRVPSISYAVFCLKKTPQRTKLTTTDKLPNLPKITTNKTT